VSCLAALPYGASWDAADRTDRKAILGHKDCRALKAIPARRAIPGRWVRQDHKGRPVKRDRRGHKGRPVKRDRKGRRVKPDPRVHKGRKVKQGRQDLAPWEWCTRFREAEGGLVAENLISLPPIVTSTLRLHAITVLPATTKPTSLLTTQRLRQARSSPRSTWTGKRSLRSMTSHMLPGGQDQDEAFASLAHPWPWHGVFTVDEGGTLTRWDVTSMGSSGENCTVIVYTSGGGPGTVVHP